MIGVLQDTGQDAINALLSPEVLQEVPGVKHVAAYVKGISAFRDALHMKKLGRFLDAFKDVSIVDRRRMVERLEAEPMYRRKAGEHITEYIDRVDSARRPAMAGLAFAAYAREEISSKMLLRLLDVIEKLPMPEVDVLRTLVVGGPGEAWADAERESKTKLGNAGLLDLHMTMDGNMWDINDTSRAFVKLELDLQTAHE